MAVPELSCLASSQGSFVAEAVRCLRRSVGCAAWTRRLFEAPQWSSSGACIPRRRREPSAISSEAPLSGKIWYRVKSAALLCTALQEVSACWPLLAAEASCPRPPPQEAPTTPLRVVCCAGQDHHLVQRAVEAESADESSALQCGEYAEADIAEAISRQGAQRAI